MLELPDVAFNFLYRQPTLATATALGWLMDTIVSTELGVATFFRRRFFWFNNLLSSVDFFPEKKDSTPGGNREGRRSNLTDVPMLVALSENDELSHAPTVRKYLQSAYVERYERERQKGGKDDDKDGPGWLRTVWWPGLSHTEFMMWPSCWRDIAAWADSQA